MKTKVEFFVNVTDYNDLSMCGHRTLVADSLEKLEDKKNKLLKELRRLEVIRFSDIRVRTVTVLDLTAEEIKFVEEITNPYYR